MRHHRTRPPHRADTARRRTPQHPRPRPPGRARTAYSPSQASHPRRRTVRHCGMPCRCPPRMTACRRAYHPHQPDRPESVCHRWASQTVRSERGWQHHQAPPSDKARRPYTACSHQADRPESAWRRRSPQPEREARCPHQTDHSDWAWPPDKVRRPRRHRTKVWSPHRPDRPSSARRRWASPRPWGFRSHQTDRRHSVRLRWAAPHGKACHPGTDCHPRLGPRWVRWRRDGRTG